MGIQTTALMNRGVVTLFRDAEGSEDITVYRSYEVHVDEEEPLPYVVDLEIDYDDDEDRFVVTSLNFSRKEAGEGVTTEGLRTIPVSKLMQRAVDDPNFLGKRERHEGFVTLTPFTPHDITGRGPSDEALRYVAAAYKFSYAIQEPPTQGVMKRLNLPRTTAGKWVMLARRRGFLGPTDERRPGPGEGDGHGTR